MTISIITITYNEAGNIHRFINTISSTMKKIKHELIIVDDKSKDKTIKIIKKEQKKQTNINLIIREKERGIGSAFKRGISETKGDTIVLMDADFSHSPKDIFKLIKIANQGKIAIGNRFIRNEDLKNKYYRIIGTKFLNKILKIFTGKKDNTNGFLAIRKKNLEEMNKLAKKLKINIFSNALYTPKVILLGKKLNLETEEIRTKYIPRVTGKSKINFIKSIILSIQTIVETIKTVKLLQ
ncbi:glycosyltransferase [Candidatus Woesearchaeota archaeon]|nr:glycosyltransferase [Candidatus Woesearchaeota archaeon]